MPINNPGLPMPPDRRQLPPTRVSPVRTLLAKMRFGAKAPLPRLTAPPVLKQTPNRAQPVPGNLYKPPSEGKVWTSNPREILSLISRFARERKVIIIRYRAKKHGMAIVTRSVEPYALRYKNTRESGRTRFFYGYDVDGPTHGIHSFLLGNIVSVQGTNVNYSPKWTVEF
jgi:hypothetical protein